MPVDVTDPASGEVIQQSSVWDCVFAWQALGAWDAGRQAVGVHAAINRAEKENSRRQDRLLALVGSPDVAQSSLPDTDSERLSGPSASLPSSLGQS